MKTSKLFYKKHPYKITFSVNGIPSIKASYRPRSSLIVKGRAIVKSNANTAIGRFSRAVHEVLDLIPNADSYCDFNTFSIFVDTEEECNLVCEKLKNWSATAYKPHVSDIKFIKENGNKKIICERYPHGSFKYKVTFNRNITSEAKTTFFTWLQSQAQDSFHISGLSLHWLSSVRFPYYIENPIIYFKDGPSLTMACMVLGTKIKKIEEYILRTSINTDQGTQ